MLIIRHSNISNPVLLHRGERKKGPVDGAYATHQLSILHRSPVDVIMYVLFGRKVATIVKGVVLI